MPDTATRTATFTITDARYVCCKLGADLRLLSNLYGKPDLGNIDDYVEEAALLLRDGYLDTVSYGFRRPDSNEWTLRVRYRATVGGRLTDGMPGALPASVKLEGSTFYSYLTYSQKFSNLESAAQEGVRKALPITRVGAEEPAARSGPVDSGNVYSRNGVGVTRDVYRSST